MALFPPRERVDRWTVLGLVAMLVVAVVWINFSAVLAVRLWGGTIVAAALVALKRGRIPYGWEGHEPSGYITGTAAVVLGILGLLMGAAFILAPHVIVDIAGAPK